MSIHYLHQGKALCGNASDSLTKLPESISCPLCSFTMSRIADDYARVHKGRPRFRSLGPRHLGPVGKGLVDGD